jgi:hypothetical protein
MSDDARNHEREDLFVMVCIRNNIYSLQRIILKESYYDWNGIKLFLSYTKHARIHTQNRHIPFSTATSMTRNAHTMLLMLQCLVLAIHYTRTVSDVRRISEELFTKVGNLLGKDLSLDTSQCIIFLPSNPSTFYSLGHSCHRKINHKNTER